MNKSIILPRRVVEDGAKIKSSQLEAFTFGNLLPVAKSNGTYLGRKFLLGKPEFCG
jgi:hypothetical protein